MKLFFVVCIMALSVGSFGQKEHVTVTIRNCFSGFSYSYQNDTIAVNMKAFNDSGDYVPYVYKTRLPSVDSVKFVKAIKSFLIVKQDEVFSNEGVMDGFQFKITITVGVRVKKIYVGNAYEERSDSLTSIFNRYFSQIEWLRNSLESNGAGYWGNKVWIEELIRDNERSRIPLSEETRKFYLNKFCEN